jgi:pSer/pThr/pTyr-binding forkhead associated (FHA) protein
VLPDDTSQVIAATTVIGRQPDAAVAPGATHTLVIDDPDGLVSKSHAVFEVDGGRLAVRDLGSTNGVVVLADDGNEIEVSSTNSTPLDDGFEVELGSFVIKIEKT